MGARLYWKIRRQKVHDNATGLQLIFGHERRDGMTVPTLTVIGRHARAEAVIRFPGGTAARRVEVSPRRKAGGRASAGPAGEAADGPAPAQRE